MGELLMLAIVLILMAVFAATASHYLPPARDPSVTIIADSVTNPSGGMDIHLYHKGGDWIRKSDLTVILSDEGNSTYRKYTKTDISFPVNPDSQSFALGEIITLPPVPESTYEVSLVTPRAVIFSGMVNPP